MALRRSSIAASAAALAVSLVLLSPVTSSPRTVRPHAPTTFVVNSTGDAPDASQGDGLCDSGGAVCTLRAAMQEANSNAGADTIHFAIGSGPQAIVPATALPSINEAVTIDGTTQPGYAGSPLIEIDGLNAVAANGFQVSAAGSLIKGLMVNRFDQMGISIITDDVTVESCWIGTGPTGDRGNGADGIYIRGDGNTVFSNAIAYNDGAGVRVEDLSQSTFPNFSGPADNSSIFQSIDFTDNCGSFQHATGPILQDGTGRAFNENFGMRLTGTVNASMPGSYTLTYSVDDNIRVIIGVTEVLNTQGSGSVNVTLSGSDAFQLDFAEGGGAADLDVQFSGPGSVTFTHGVSNPGLQGELYQQTDPSENNTISQNSIFDNGGQGIALGCCCLDTNDTGDIDFGANAFLNFPEITSHLINANGSITVQGTAPIGSFVEVFGSTNDAGGRGEGKLYLATSAIVPGDGSFIATFNLPQPYYSVTTTATDATGNTSEFSPNTIVRPRRRSRSTTRATAGRAPCATPSTKPTATAWPRSSSSSSPWWGW
jgi:CSLREA domain-containing protein